MSISIRFLPSATFRFHPQDLISAYILVILFSLPGTICGQNRDMKMELVATGGIFATPIAGAPFSAEVEQDVSRFF